jgi:hypothetical protein
MIEQVLTLLRLALGLGGIFLLGYALLAALLPRPLEFTLPERVAYGFGAGVTVLTLWMLLLTWHGLNFSLWLMAGPLLALSVILLLTARGRAALAHDFKAARPFSLGLRGWDYVFTGLLVLVLAFATLRAMLYPIWAWDAVATWGCKARVFYVTRGVDLTCIEAHNYYPNLLPLLLSYLYFCLGRVNDYLVNAVFPLWGGLLLTLLYSCSRRLGLSRRQALGLAAFLALNGTVFIVHLYIAYADLPVAFFALGAAGLMYLWLTDTAPRGSLFLSAVMMAGLAWCKYEGPPLAATLLLAAILTLAWLRPADWLRRLGLLAIPAAGLLAGFLPWRLFSLQHHIAIGSDHIQSFYPQQLIAAFSYLAAGLAQPFYFGILWPALILALILSGPRLWRSPRLFLALFLGGNLLAIILAYAVVPTSAAEFPAYVRATLDRLLLHISPCAALFLGLVIRDLWGEKDQPAAVTDTKK